ncbi:MAG: Gfo/Idh/MocA family oxidoreductase [Verrucomicrobia bacterium]|nr:Gfo/Idh/MocA family oxidoreductase [Verrucomicrobiota bacterium]
MISKTKTNPIGYVGCGFMAQNVHLPNFSELCGIAALAERRPDLAERVARKFNVPTIYSDHRQLANDPNIVAVGLSADYAQQGEIAADLLRAGKHVFMEKPMAVSVKQSQRILAAAKAGNSRLMIGYMKRFDPANILVRKIVTEWRQSGSKGRLLYARNHGFCGNWLAGQDDSQMIRTDEPVQAIDNSMLLPDWLPATKRKGYIGYLQQYTHNVNLLRFLLGAESQQEVKITHVDLDPDGMTGIVSIDVAGVRAIVESASSRFHAWDEHTQIYFEGAWVHVWPASMFSKPSYSKLEVYEGGEIATYHYPVTMPQSVWHYREEARHFLECLDTGENFRSSGEDTAIDVWLNEEIYKRHVQE